MTCDQKSYDLAEAFLADHPDHLPTDTIDLAEWIQRAIEDWLVELEERQKITPGCIHAKRGLCVSCYAEYEVDPTAWDEFGYHPQGLANWKELQAELASMPPVTEPPDPNLPL